MKYLKPYEEYEFLEKVKDPIRDIIDDGHDVYCGLHEFKEYIRLDVFITFLDSEGNQSHENLKNYGGLFEHLISELESQDWHLNSAISIIHKDDNKSGREGVHTVYARRLTLLQLDTNDHTTEIRRIEIRFDLYK